MKYIITDIDGTLVRHSKTRLMALEQRNWDAYHKLFDSDQVNEGVVQAISGAASFFGRKIVAWTGSSDAYYQSRIKFLRDHFGSFRIHDVHMRKGLDHTQSNLELKKEWAKFYDPREVSIIYEDQFHVAAMLRSLGYNVCLVMGEEQFGETI